MMFVRLVRVSFSYSDSVPLLTDVDFQLTNGWTAMVGANGTGKTTLLRLISGELAPDSGDIHFAPLHPRIAVCRQTAETLTDEIEEFGSALDRESHRIRDSLKLSAADLSRWSTLSPGERRRFQIGAALATDPSMLILDEPTDHLDGEAREILVSALMRFGGIGVVVSHDRTLLDALTTSTVRIHNGTARLWRGGYSNAKRSWEAEERQIHVKYDRLKRQRETLRRRLADKRRSLAATELATNAGRKMKNIHDYANSETGHERMAAKTLSRQTATLRDAVTRVSGQLEQFQFRKEPGRSIFINYVPAPNGTVFRLSARSVSVGNRKLLRDVSLVMGRSDRVRIAGPNGSGKTTLLKLVIESATLPSEKMLYLPQELTADDAAALVEAARGLPATERAEVLTMAAALGIEPDNLLASHSVSPGEARKLKLAWGLGRQVWAMVLDEPTNHLDMPAIERLEDALADYPGALLLVTHDDRLAGRTTNLQMTIRDGRLQLAG